MMESLAVGAGHGDGVASVSLLFGVLRLIALCFHSGVSEPSTVAQDCEQGNYPKHIHFKNMKLFGRVAPVRKGPGWTIWV